MSDELREVVKRAIDAIDWPKDVGVEVCTDAEKAKIEKIRAERPPEFRGKGVSRPIYGDLYHLR